jgi:hypothetical protein
MISSKQIKPTDSAVKSRSQIPKKYKKVFELSTCKTVKRRHKFQIDHTFYRDFPILTYRPLIKLET